MAETVLFTAMKDGTREEYTLLARLEKPFLALTADRVLDELRRADEVPAPFAGGRRVFMKLAKALEHLKKLIFIRSCSINNPA
ncbi:hypothetical protein [Roseicyclus sp.]|uniref:hypothetical protein n=1 Tax=Roseicyclus sp. TaxID=1914329 RepID=UPI003F6C7377